MTDRAKLIAETAAVIDADVRTALAGGPVTLGDLKAAVIRSAMSLMPPAAVPAIEIARDPRDPNRMIVTVRA